jgi:hypothetical protein
MEFDYAAHGLDPDRFLMRRDIAELAKTVFGIPITKNHIDKAAAAGQGPPVDAAFGTKHLTRVRHAIPWILSRVRPTAGAASLPPLRVGQAS